MAMAGSQSNETARRMGKPLEATAHWLKQSKPVGGGGVSSADVLGLDVFSFQVCASGANVTESEQLPTGSSQQSQLDQ